MDYAAPQPDESHAGSAGAGDKRYVLGAFCLIVLGTIFHLAYSTHLELVGDEAYYWLWSRHPDICYLDKGPMIAWLIRAGTAIFGQTVFGVRFFAVILGGGTGLAIFLLGRRLFSARAAFWSVVIASIIPLFAVGASLMTIDTVYVFFWSWAALAFWWAKDEGNLFPWILTGALVGLGLLSKYTAAIQLVSFGVFCLWHAPSRTHFRRGTFWVMMGTALLFLAPAIFWNIREHWPTSSWLLQRGGLDKRDGFHPGFALAFLGEQAGVISPLLFLGLLFIFFRRSVWRAGNPSMIFAAALFLPLFGLYLFLSLHYLGPPNCTAAAYVGGVLLLTASWLDVIALHRWTKWLALVALLLAGVETTILLETRGLNLPHGSDPLDRARGSRNLAAQVAHAQQETGAQFIIADHYMTAALLSFYLPGQPETFVPIVSQPRNQLELWPTFDEKYPAAAGLIVAKRAKVAGSLRLSFLQISSLGTVDARDGGRKIGTYYLFVATRNHRSQGQQGTSRP